MSERDIDGVYEYSRVDGSETAQMARDLRLATVTDLPVLISGTPAASREIACELDRQSRSPKGAVAVVDCRERGALGALQSLTHDPIDPDDAAAVRILLLQEVHALDPVDQALLEKEIEELRMRPGRPLRILASSSAPLFDRVVDQLFSERLYYRLNVIHLIVPPRRLISEETVG
jgi:transcriptional regulator of acetoin/glycerol metabolism